MNIGTIKFEHDFNDTFTLREQFRAGGVTRRDFRISQADTSAIVPGTPLQDMQVDRAIIDGSQHRTGWWTRTSIFSRNLTPAPSRIRW